MRAQIKIYFFCVDSIWVRAAHGIRFQNIYKRAMQSDIQAAIRKTRTFAKTNSGHTDEATLDYVPHGRFVIMTPFEVLTRLYRRRTIALTDELIKIKPGRTKLRTNETNEPKTRTNLVSYGRD